jgi:hypothetical protein
MPLGTSFSTSFSAPLSQRASLLNAPPLLFTLNELFYSALFTLPQIAFLLQTPFTFNNPTLLRDRVLEKASCEHSETG